jgi:hypothetical protein
MQKVILMGLSKEIPKGLMRHLYLVIKMEKYLHWEISMVKHSG